MKKISLAVTLAFLNVMAFAQEKVDADVDLNVNDGGSASSFPWMYVIGAVLLIVVLIALLGNRGGTDRVIERRTVVKD